MTRPPTSHAAAPGHDARWRWWFGPVGFATALTVTVVVSSLLAGVVRVTGGDGHRTDHAVALVGILIQDAAFILVAVVFARGVGGAPATSFGLRPTRLAPAAGLVALSLIVFYAVSAARSSLISSAGKQDTLATLGTQETPVLLIVSAIAVIAVAPLAEELFFRGFFYGALRSRLSAPAATAVVSLLFAAIHYTGPDTLASLPMLALLSALFCVLYERTRSLWPAVALHTINNTIAFAATAGAPGATLVAASIGLLALSACILIPARARLAVRAARS